MCYVVGPSGGRGGCPLYKVRVSGGERGRGSESTMRGFGGESERGGRRVDRLEVEMR